MKPGNNNGKKGKGGENPPLDPEEQELWEDVMQDVTPLADAPKAVTRPRPYRKRTVNPETSTLPRQTNYGNEEVKTPPGLDRRTDERLRGGHMKVEARLDLHNMTQDRALSALEAFIADCYERGCRCVLIITGTGARHRDKKENAAWYEPQPGILHERVPQWLRSGRLSHMVLRFYPAQKRHGGEGALYVLIRRRR